jgi:hypothetical protein
MKKFFYLIAAMFMVVGFTAIPSAKLKAQSIMAQTDPAGAAATVNTNADTSYHAVDLAGQSFNYKYLTITLKGTKTSGTVLGTAALQGSNDNSRWFSVYASKDGKLADTTTIQGMTDTDNNLLWIVSGSKFRYYRVVVITQGTQVSSYVCRLLGRKVEN